MSFPFKRTSEILVLDNGKNKNPDLHLQIGIIISVGNEGFEPPTPSV